MKYLFVQENKPQRCPLSKIRTPYYAEIYQQELKEASKKPKAIDARELAYPSRH